MKAVLTVHLGLLIDIEPEEQGLYLYVKSPSVPGMHVIGTTAAQLSELTGMQLTKLLADNHNLKVEWLTTQAETFGQPAAGCECGEKDPVEQAACFKHNAELCHATGFDQPQGDNDAR